MASEAAHIAAANRTQKTIDHLCLDPATHAPWIAALAFYKALHIIEAIFAGDPTAPHTADHVSRFARLKTTRKFEKLYRHYSRLSRASLIARYLADDRQGYSTFDDYMDAGQVVGTCLLHHLKQVETSASRFLQNPTLLTSVESARPIAEAALARRARGQ